MLREMGIMYRERGGGGERERAGRDLDREKHRLVVGRLIHGQEIIWKERERDDR